LSSIAGGLASPIGFESKEGDVRNLITAAFLIVSICISSTSAHSEEVEIIGNLLEGAPYVDSGRGARALVDENHLLMMQVALKPGQSVPQHEANSNVHIIILDGEVVITLAGQDIAAREGDLISVAFMTPMSITNNSQANVTFVIIKTPNPTQMSE